MAAVKRVNNVHVHLRSRKKMEVTMSVLWRQCSATEVRISGVGGNIWGKRGACLGGRCSGVGGVWRLAKDVRAQTDPP